MSRSLCKLLSQVQATEVKVKVVMRDAHATGTRRAFVGVARVQSDQAENRNVGKLKPPTFTTQSITLLIIIFIVHTYNILTLLLAFYVVVARRLAA